MSSVCAASPWRWKLHWHWFYLITPWGMEKLTWYTKSMQVTYVASLYRAWMIVQKINKSITQHQLNIIMIMITMIILLTIVQQKYQLSQIIFLINCISFLSICFCVKQKRFHSSTKYWKHLGPLKSIQVTYVLHQGTHVFLVF